MIIPKPELTLFKMGEVKCCRQLKKKQQIKLSMELTSGNVLVSDYR